MKHPALLFWFLMACVVPRLHAAEPVPNSKPNFVLILCDDLGYGDLACFNNPIIKTPNLDRLAAEGMRLTDCYASFPVCSPSRAGFMTGRNANRLGIREWISPGTGIYMRPREITIAQMLKKAGYRTGHFGKWHLNSVVDGSETTPGDAGFDDWIYTQNNAAPSHENPTNFVRMGKRMGALNGFSTTILTDEAIRFVSENKSGPFFLNLWFHAPHEPVATPEDFQNIYSQVGDQTKRIYYGSVSLIDDNVGRLMKKLDELKLRENTFVLFTSDNGPETLNRYKGAERSHGSPGPLRGMKLHITEAGYRVPGIIRWPGHTHPNEICSEPVNNTDLLPTICEITGVPVPSDRPIDGTSILPIFTGKEIQRKTPLYWQYDYAISRPWTVALRERNWKLLATPGLDKFALYDLSADVGEAKDLADEFPDRVRQMAEKMKQLNFEIKSEGEKSGNPMPRQGGRKQEKFN